MAFLNHWLLAILLLIPASGAIAVLFIRPLGAMRWTALGTTLASLCIALLLLIPFHAQKSGNYAYGPHGTVQLLCQLDKLHIPRGLCKIALDGLSFPLVVLTTIICSAACAASISLGTRSRTYFSLLLFFEATTLGFFLAFDLRLFYIFLGLSVISAGLLNRTHGGDSRRAGLRLLIYMLVSLACLFIAFWGVHLASRAAYPGGSFDLISLTSRGMTGTGRVLFLLALVGFLIRLPIIPFHGWFSDLLSESPGPIAALLGTLIPLTGGYGLLRIAWPLFWQTAISLWLPVSILGVLAILYGALRAVAEEDLKRSIAYASTSMMGFFLLGVAAVTPTGMNAAAFVLVSQCMIVAIFLLAQAGNSTLSNGLVANASIRSIFLIIACIAMMTVPGLLAQISAVLGILQAARPDSLLMTRHESGAGAVYFIAIAASLGVVLIGIWGIRVIRQVFSTSKEAERVTDLLPRDASYLAPMTAIMLVFGLFPVPLFFTFTQRALEAMLKSLG